MPGSNSTEPGRNAICFSLFWNNLCGHFSMCHAEEIERMTTSGFGYNFDGSEEGFLHLLRRAQCQQA